MVVTGLEGHGLKTTVVEIDPAVSEYARSYFGCPKPSGGILTMDARRFFADNTGKYQYIVHDVFTGGALPIKLFTSEAWKDVKRALAPQGVLAVQPLPTTWSSSAPTGLSSLETHRSETFSTRTIGESYSKTSRTERWTWQTLRSPESGTS